MNIRQEIVGGFIRDADLDAFYRGNHQELDPNEYMRMRDVIVLKRLRF